MAAPPGLEPGIIESESIVLPITLRGKPGDIVIFSRVFGKGNFIFADLKVKLLKKLLLCPCPIDKLIFYLIMCISKKVTVGFIKLAMKQVLKRLLKNISKQSKPTVAITSLQKSSYFFGNFRRTSKPHGAKQMLNLKGNYNERINSKNKT